MSRVSSRILHLSSFIFHSSSLYSQNSSTMSRQAITSLSSTASRIGAPSRLPATIRAFSSSSSLASGSATPLQNTINVDPRVLDGQTFLPKANVDRLCEWQTGLWERLAKEVRSEFLSLDFGFSKVSLTDKGQAADTFCLNR